MISKRQFWILVSIAAVVLAAWGYLTAGRLLAERVRLTLIPAMASATGLDLAVDDVKVRPFPLFLEVRGIQVEGTDRRARLEVGTLRAYVDLLAYVLHREIRVTYLWGSDVRLTGSTDAFQKIADRLKAASAGGEDEHPDAAQDRPRFRLQRFMVEKLKLDLDVADKLHVTSEPMRITGKTEPYSLEFWGGLVTIRGQGKVELPVTISGELALAPDDALVIRNMDLESRGAGVTLDGRFSLRRSDLRLVADLPMASVVNILNLKGPSEGQFSVDGFIRAEGTDPSEMSLDLDVQGDGYIENLFDALDIPPEVKGHVTGKAHLSGKVTDLKAGGHMTLEKGSIVGLGDAWVESDFSFGDRTLRFDGGNGKIIGGEARRVDVALSFGDPLVYDVSCEVAAVDSQRLFEFIGWVPPHRPGRMTGTVKVRGNTATLSSLDVSGHALFEGEGGGGNLFEKISRAESDFLYKDRVLRLDALSASAPEWKASGAVRADFQRDSVIADFQAGGQDVGALLMEKRKDLHAPFNVSGRVDGPMASPFLAGKLVFGKGTIAGFSFDSAEADANFHSGTLTVDRLMVRSGTGLLDGSGTVRGLESLQSDPSGRGVDLALNAKVQGLEVGPVADLLGGDPEPFGRTRVSGQVRVTGSPVAARIETRGRSERGVIYGQSFDEAEIDAVAEPAAVTVRSLVVNRKRSTLRMSGTVGRTVPSCLEFFDSRIYLEDIDGVPKGWQGLVRIDADCSLTRRAGQKAVDGSGRVSIENLAFKKLPLGRADLNLSLADRVLTAEGKFLEGLGRVSGLANLAESGTWSMDVSLARANYTKFLGAILGTTKPEFAIEGEARANIRRAHGVTGGSVEVRDLALSAYSQSFRSSDSIRIDVDGSKVVIPPLRLISGESYLEGQGVVDLGTSVDLKLNGRVDLLVLRAFSPSFESVSGTTWIVLEARGPWDSPDINGGVFVDDGYISMKGAPGHFSQIKGTVFVDNGSVSTDDLSCRWGGGDLKLKGLGRIRGMGLGEFHYDLQAARVLLQPIDDLSLRLDADLSFDGRGGNRYLSGDVIFAHAVYRGRVDYKSWLAQLRQKQAVPAESTWLGNTELNIHLTGSEPFLIENNLGRVTFWADHRLLGTLARPRLMGRVEVDQGQVFFRNHDFKVTSGSMDFIGAAGINPICDLKAETWTQGYSIRLTLDGPLDKLALNLESTPPLIETDILALLTVGKISRDLKGLEGEVGAAEAASFLSGDIQDTVESKVTSVTGFDRFQFDPHLNQSQGGGKSAMGPRLTVGKRLFSDKLFVTYSSDISTSEGQAVSLEYQVAPGTTVVGERDEMGNRGADVRLHFKFD